VKKIVVPGEEIEDENVRTHVYRDNGKKYSMIHGVLYKTEGYSKIIPLTHRYMPKEGDTVIGIVESVKYGGCIVKLNAPYDAFLETREDYEIGDVVSAKVESVSEVKDIKLGNERKFHGGEVFDIDPSKIKRIIGKKASMVTMIKEKTGSKIFVGQNGRVWVKDGDIEKVEEVMRKIEREAHETGLTEKIENYLTGDK